MSLTKNYIWCWFLGTDELTEFCISQFMHVKPEMNWQFCGNGDEPTMYDINYKSKGGLRCHNYIMWQSVTPRNPA